MKPEDKTGNEAIIKAQLRDDLHRSQTNEKKLMDQNAEMKKQLSSLTKVEMSLKKEQVEVTKLQNKVYEYESFIKRKMEGHNKVKQLLRDEKTKRVQEKTVSDQRITDLKKELVEMKNQYDVEKRLREQKDKDLEKFQNMNEDHRKLLLEDQDLRTQVKEMTELKTFSARTIEELKKELHSAEEECKNTKCELFKLKEKETLCREQEKELRICQSTLTNCQNQNHLMEQELEKCLKDADANKREINWLKKENANLTKNRECDSVVIKGMEQRMLTLGQTIKRLKDELYEKEKEKEKLQHTMQNLKDELAFHKELKRKLKEQENKNTALISNTDSEIVKLRNMYGDLERKYKHQKVVHVADLSEKKLISQRLNEAEEALDLNSKMLEKMTKNVKDMTFDIDQKKSELHSLNQKWDGAKGRIKKLDKKLEELKISKTFCIESAEKEKIRAAKILSQTEDLNKQLSTKIKQADEHALQQTKKIDILQQENAEQEHTIKECDEHIKTLMKQNLEIQGQYDLQFKFLKKKMETCDAAYHPNFLDVTTQPPSKLPQQTEKEKLPLQQTVVEQEQEFVSLINMIAKVPDDTPWKLSLCHHDIKKHQEELKASKAIAMTYSTDNEKLTEENKRLTDEVRELKLKCESKSKKICLPAVTEKATSLSLNKPKNKLKDLGYPCLPPIPTRSSVPHAESKKDPPSHLSDISCHGKPPYYIQTNEPSTKHHTHWRAFWLLVGFLRGLRFSYNI